MASERDTEPHQIEAQDASLTDTDEDEEEAMLSSESDGQSDNDIVISETTKIQLLKVELAEKVKMLEKMTRKKRALETRLQKGSVSAEQFEVLKMEYLKQISDRSSQIKQLQEEKRREEEKTSKLSQQLQRVKEEKRREEETTSKLSQQLQRVKEEKRWEEEKNRLAEEEANELNEQIEQVNQKYECKVQLLKQELAEQMLKSEELSNEVSTLKNQNSCTLS